MSGHEVMLPEHPRWGEFISRVNRAPICMKTTEHARAALETMQDIDIERSLSALARLGGTCDCEIVFVVGGEAERVDAS